MNLFSGGNTVNEILVAAKSPDVMDRGAAGRSTIDAPRDARPGTIAVG